MTSTSGAAARTCSIVCATVNETGTARYSVVMMPPAVSSGYPSSSRTSPRSAGCIAPSSSCCFSSGISPRTSAASSGSISSSLSAEIHADETVVAVGARETQVVGAHDLVALDVHDLAVEDLHAQTQLPVVRLVGRDRVEGVAQDDRLLERDDLFPRHVDGSPA